MKIIDTHCHFNDERIFANVDEVVLRAKNVGVCEIYNNGDSLESFKNIIDLQKRFPGFCHSVLGIHPEFADQSDVYFNKAYAFIEEHIALIDAIGEIGLDYHYSKDETLIKKQKQRFIEQIHLAKKYNLPIVVHSRDADFDTLNIIKSELPSHVDLHCFSGSVEILREYLKLPISFYIGVGGVCTFKNAKTIKEVITATPTSRILTETDSPYLAPTPHRGEANESSYLPLIIHQIAIIKNEQEDVLADQLFMNGKDFYSHEL